MDIKELQKKLQGVYDFTNVVDCQSVISMLLKDLAQEKHRADLLSVELRILAKLVSCEKPEAKSRAEHVLNGVKQRVNVMDFLGRMSESMTDAENMTDKRLHDAVMQIWAEFNMDSMESGVLGELLKRFKEGKHVGNEVPKVRQDTDVVQK